ncbi:MAG: hypothetical protein CM1200mP2_28160 [Planctomycetaceae bacterium]|nr:MAG: hypothetical protein CM1200mP2_28160 [Planctomycetaceae bacterium]
MTVGLAVILSSIACKGLPVSENNGPQARIRFATVAMHSELGDFETNLARIAFWSAKARGARGNVCRVSGIVRHGFAVQFQMTQESARAIATKAMAIARPRWKHCARNWDDAVVGL